MSNASSITASLLSATGAEKALWYREVLSLDPDSRIFLPYARLLAELERIPEAIETLKSGLHRHPEFLEARLLLIDLLKTSGQTGAAELEAAELIELLSHSACLWEIWAARPGLRPDQAALLKFFGYSLRQDGVSLADVFEAGIRSLSERRSTPAVTSDMPKENHSAPVAPLKSEVAEGNSGVAEQTGSCESSATGRVTPVFVMDDKTPWYSLDAVPEDDDPDYADDEDYAVAGVSTDVSTVGKSSLCTRSMADILEEQGAMEEAAAIYRELLTVSDSEAEKAELNSKLNSLIKAAGKVPAASQNTSHIVKMLETLADRLENKSRA